jgi:hypothetical protein
MLRKLLIAGMSLSILAPAGAVFADDWDDRFERRYERAEERYERKWEKARRQHERRAEQLDRRERRLNERERRLAARYRDYYGDRRGYYYAPRYGYYDVPDAYYGRSYHRGQRIPDYFLRYRAYDPYSYGGYRTNRGRWYHAGDDLYLVDPQTRMILDVLSNIF